MRPAKPIRVVAFLRRTGECAAGFFAGVSIWGLLVFVSGCLPAPPLPIDDSWVVQQLSHRYREFFPSSHPTALDRGGDMYGLLRPRFGLPAIVQAGTSFPLELLERTEPLPPSLPEVALLQPEVGAAAAIECLRGEKIPGCQRLRVEPLERKPTAEGFVEARYTVFLESAWFPPPGGYDLVVTSRSANLEEPTRAPRAVWLRAEDPASLSQVRVAHLSDLHIGKGGKSHALIQTHLEQVIRDVNRQGPDLVIVTGDIVNSGQYPELWPVARELLQNVESPVLVVLGNHDIEFKGRGFTPVRRYGAGWSNFARTFHPFLHFAVSLGGYDFVGFDSGPGERTARILTRGLHPSSVALLRGDLLQAQERGQRGVILFSHAPSRASTFNRVAPRSAGFFGHMRYGRTAFESMLVEAALRGQRVLHLAGHTHWSDVFELDPLTRQFRRWPNESLSPCPRPLRSQVALITTQAAGHSGLFSKANARGYGFALLTLGSASVNPELEVIRYGTAAPTRCLKNPNNIPTLTVAAAGSASSS